MRDDFEKELQDIMSGFDGQPDAGTWTVIRRRIHGKLFSFLNSPVFLWGMLAVTLGGFLWWQFRPDFKEARHLISESGSQDTLILKTEKHKGYGLFEENRSYWALNLEEIAVHEELNKVIPKDISNPKFAQEYIDFKPWQYDYLKKGKAEFLDKFLKDYYPSKIDTSNLPLEKDNTVRVIVGMKNDDKVFIVDENNNGDFRDDPIRLLGSINAEDFTSNMAKCHYRIFNGKEIVGDFSWVHVGEFKDQVQISVAHHLRSSFSLDKQEYEIQVVNGPPLLRFAFDSPIVSVTSRNGVKKDSLFFSDRLEIGEYVKLGESYYKFEDMTNDGSEITFVEEEDISDKVGTTVGLIAPHFEGLTTEADSVYTEDFSGKYLLLVNLTACASPKMSYEHYKELSDYYRSRIDLLAIDVSPLTLQTNIDELGLEGAFMIANYNKSIKDNYREDHCSRVCFLIGPDGRIVDKFEIKDWKQALGKYFE